MRKLMLSAAALGALAAAMPAAAQYGGRYDSYGYNNGYGYQDSRWGDQRLRQLSWRLDRAERSGQLSRWEARDLRQRLNDLYRLEARLDDNGYNRAERFELDRRADALARRIDYAARDGRGWNDRRYDDRDNPYAQYDYR